MKTSISILEDRKPEDMDRLLLIWEKAVIATHHFLAEGHVDTLRPMLKEWLPLAPEIIVARDGQGVIQGFLASARRKIEMLFIHPDCHSRGLGRKLVEMAAEKFGVNSVDTNEQNDKGVGFYKRLGFKKKGRSPLDEQGYPYPILHLYRD